MPVSSPYPFIGGSILGGTPGSVLFIGATGLLAEDTRLTYVSNLLTVQSPAAGATSPGALFKASLATQDLIRFQQDDGTAIGAIRSVTDILRIGLGTVSPNANLHVLSAVISQINLNSVTNQTGIVGAGNVSGIVRIGGTVTGDGTEEGEIVATAWLRVAPTVTGAASTMYPIEIAGSYTETTIAGQMTFAGLRIGPTVTAATSSNFGIQSNPTFVYSGAGSGSSLNFQATATGAGNGQTITGASGTVAYQGTGTGATISGFLGAIVVSAGSGTGASVYGYRVTSLTTNVNVATMALFEGGSGLVLSGGATATTFYGLHLPAITGATTNWAILSEGGQSAHTGNLRIGSTTAPTVALDVTGSVNVSTLTAGRVVFAGTSGLLSDDADLTFATDTLTMTKGLAVTSFASSVNDVATLGTSSLGWADLYLATGAQIFENNANPKRTLILSAAGGKGTTTAGAAGPTQVESTTNDVNCWAMEFDTTTEEAAFWNVQMPDNYDGSTITARFVWTNAAGLTTETVRWGIKARAFADSDAIDQAFGSEVTVDDTWLAQNDVHISAASSAVTIGGSPAGGRWVVINVARKTASDNLTGDARLLAVQIEYGINSYGD